MTGDRSKHSASLDGENGSDGCVLLASCQLLMPRFSRKNFTALPRALPMLQRHPQSIGDELHVFLVGLFRHKGSACIRRRLGCKARSPRRRASDNGQDAAHEPCGRRSTSRVSDFSRACADFLRRTGVRRSRSSLFSTVVICADVFSSLQC